MIAIEFILWTLMLIKVVAEPMEKIGMSIRLPFPNEQSILGVGGLSYSNDNNENLWMACTENIGSTKDDEDVDTALPRLYYMNLDFDNGGIEFILDQPVVVQPHFDLKLEDMALVPTSGNRSNPLDKEVWLASESHSDLVRTTKFLTKDFGPPDMTSYDPDSFVDSRLIRVNATTGRILEEAILPDFTHWDMDYDWDGTMCVGNRPFQGLHALSIVPSSNPDYDHVMFAAFQAALYQDGNAPTDFSESATRILMYGLKALKEGDDRESTTSTFLKSFRYDTSRLTLKSYQKSASHFNGLFAILAINETSLLVVECEDLTVVGRSENKITNRIFYVELNSEESIDKCASLLDCDIKAPAKYLIWERNDDEQLDGITWGPQLEDGRMSVAFAYENDDKVGVHFELFAFNEGELDTILPWSPTDTSAKLLERRTTVTIITASILFAAILVQLVWVKKLETINEPNTEALDSDDHIGVKSLKFTFSHYALLSAMMNSFIVGGLTYGYSGMVLMLRKEGLYADFCSCGSFCAKQKEQLALVSTVGFATTIGSRVFVGLFMDMQGPKTTAIICSILCLSAFSLLASVSNESFASVFLPAWILLSVGGSGLHITGFHLTNLFLGDGKKKASVGISAAFGASSAIFPIMQVLNQYAEIRLQAMMMFYTGIACIVVLNNFLIQPWSKVKKGEKYTPKFNVFKRSWWSRDLVDPPSLTSIKNDVVKFEFMGETLAYSVMLLLLTHFLSTSTQLMYEKGDVPFTNDPNNWSDYMFAKMAGWFNALGFLWLPLVKYMITKFEWKNLYTMLVLVYVSAAGIVFVNNLEVQVVTFLLLSFGRLLLFSCHHTYLLDVFGIANFGTLNGISSLIAAILGFSSYPLQLFALQTNYAMSFIPVSVLALLGFLFPFSLSRKGSRNFSFNNNMKISKGEEGTSHNVDDFACIKGNDHLTMSTTLIGDDKGIQLISSEEKVKDYVNVTNKNKFEKNARSMVNNWAETAFYNPMQFRYPESVQDVITLIKMHSKIRCAGALHSCAPLIASQGIIMSLTKLDKIINIDPEQMIVKVQAGVRIHQLCEALAPLNLAVGTLGTIDWQTLCGAVMTGTHGGALTLPSLHSFVTAYTLIKPDGSLKIISKQHDPILFSAMAPSLGLFGAVVEMEMKVVPLQILEARMKVLPFDDLVDSFEILMKSNKYARVVVYPSINKATVWTANPISSRDAAVANGATNSLKYVNFRDEHEKSMLENSLSLCTEGKFDEADDLIHQVLHSQLQRLSHYVGQYNHILCKERNNGIPHADIEFNFDFKKNKDVLRAVKSYCAKKRVPYYNFEIRTTKQDDAMLSCCNGRDSMWIDFQAKANMSHSFFSDIEKVLTPIGFRKHWAKGLDNFRPENALREFPKVGDFLRLVKEIDPTGKFRNTEDETWYKIMMDESVIQVV